MRRSESGGGHLVPRGVGADREEISTRPAALRSNVRCERYSPLPAGHSALNNRPQPFACVYDLDRPRYLGLHELAIAPVVSGGRPRLRWLLGNGRVLVEDDSIPGFDLGALRVAAVEATKGLLGIDVPGSGVSLSPRQDA
jgi:hypothetical protein